MKSSVFIAVCIFRRGDVVSVCIFMYVCVVCAMDVFVRAHMHDYIYIYIYIYILAHA